LPITWEENAACPVAPELAIEIISPGQTFGQMTQKASRYPDAAPITYTSDRLISDSLFPELSIVTNQLF
jgi:hypothetical protein